MITILFFLALIVPLIQNVGITILQARNQMRFRSLLYIVIAMFSLVGQILLAKSYGAIGCAVSIAMALLVGQGVIMNIYYHRKQHINIPLFWREIGKMSVVPAVMVAVGVWLTTRYDVADIGVLAVGLCLFSLIYLPLFWRFSLSDGERDMVKSPIRGLLKRMTA